MRSVANVLSWVFHPLLLTTWLILLLHYFFQPVLGINPPAFLRFILFVTMITFVFPVLNVALMVKLSGPEASIMMPERKQRVGPFVVIAIIYCFFAGLFLYRDMLGAFFTYTVQLIAVLVVTGAIITFFYKISIHSLGMGGVAGILVGMNSLTDGILLVPAVVATVLTGLVMSARLVLNAHDLRQVLSGGLVGFLIGLTGMVLKFS